MGTQNPKRPRILALNLIAFPLQVSVDELMFLISETVGADPEDVAPYVESLLEVWELLGNVKLTKARFTQMAVEPAGRAMMAMEPAGHAMSVAHSFMR